VIKRIVTLVLALILVASPVVPVSAAGPVSPATDTCCGDESVPKTSSRLIVELDVPPLVTTLSSEDWNVASGRLTPQSLDAQRQLAAIEEQQAAFANAMQTALPASTVSTYMDEYGKIRQATYQLVMNGMAVDPGVADTESARRILSSIPGVKHVYPDYAHYPDVYTSTQLINAPAAWDSAAIGGRENAGRGVKVASMDGGIHKDAPMFDGTFYEYPAGYPPGGLGLTSNNNGKIIVSRAYFRTWDPPAAGDENPWPGENGTPHGCHTSSIAAGDIVTGTYLGMAFPNMSGVAPKAWLMSYRVFYESVTSDGSFYTAEGLAALEDIVADGADVLNNSWGGGPSSVGGEFDALDTALRNVAAAGTFVVMSEGNAGPGLGTGDHPSDAYMNVGACSSGGSLASGRLSAIAPEPVSEDLQGISYASATFGSSFPVGSVITFSAISANSVDPTNVEGCSAWTGSPFQGRAVLIKRGTCEFGQKVLLAEQAGASMVIVYNHEAGGDTLVTMAGGDYGGQVTIPSIFVGNTAGQALVDWADANIDDAVLEINTLAFQAGNQPDVIASFSSRGPGVGNVLKPDIVAPGVNILAQGYAEGATGEDRHLGYGQASGTSMSAPHVTGAAALLRQIHPDWSNAYIKSALMSTAKYLEVYNSDGSPAQPLDMGAGRLDLTNAADPGVILDPPSLSFGQVVTGTTQTLTLSLTSVAGITETYALSTLYTGAGFDATTSLPGFGVSPDSVELAPGETAEVTVTFDSVAGSGIGDNQGYIVLDGTTYDAHLPVWVRVIPAAEVADILIIDNDASTTLGFPNYSEYYTSTVEALGYSYEYRDADMYYNNPATIPDAANLSAYRAILYFTGDNYYRDGTFTVATPLTQLDQDRLTEYANNGGSIIAMGQDLSAVLASDATDDGTFFYSAILGGNFLQDDITGAYEATVPIVPLDDAPTAFKNTSIDVSTSGDGAANQAYIDEIKKAPEKNPDLPDELLPYMPLFRYPGTNNIEKGIVAMSHRDQPTLERAGISHYGRCIYAAFGLEGVNDDTGGTTRQELLQLLLNWGWDEPNVTIVDTTPTNASKMVTLRADLSSNIAGVTGMTYRWDFGDGTAYTAYYTSSQASHTYQYSGQYTVRVEVIDSYGNRSIGETDLLIIDLAETQLRFLPEIFNTFTR